MSSSSKAVARRDERGMTTAEYAVGTLAAVSLGGVLIKVILDPQVFQVLLKILLWILNKIFGMA